MPCCSNRLRTTRCSASGLTGDQDDVVAVGSVDERERSCSQQQLVASTVPSPIATSRSSSRLALSALPKRWPMEVVDRAESSPSLKVQAVK